MILVPLGITLRRTRLLSEHMTEGEAVDATVKVAVGLSGWTVDVLPPATCEALRAAPERLNKLIRYGTG